MALQSTHGLCFRYDNDVFVYAHVRYQLCEPVSEMTFLPSFNLTIPRIPAMLETLLVPSEDPSFRRRSPEGLSIIRVAAAGVDGEVKA